MAVLPFQLSRLNSKEPLLGKAACPEAPSAGEMICQLCNRGKALEVAAPEGASSGDVLCCHMHISQCFGRPEQRYGM